MDDLEKKRRLGPVTDEEVAGRLLHVAKPARDHAREAALLDRIVVQAERTPRVVVTAVERPSIAAVTSHLAQQAIAPRRPPLLSRNETWGAAGLLAASLLVGFFAGQTTLTQTTMQRVAEASGVSLTSASQDIARVLASAEHEDDD